MLSKNSRNGGCLHYQCKEFNIAPENIYILYFIKAHLRLFFSWWTSWYNMMQQNQPTIADQTHRDTTGTVDISILWWANLTKNCLCAMGKIGFDWFSTTLSYLPPSISTSISPSLSSSTHVNNSLYSSFFFFDNRVDGFLGVTSDLFAHNAIVHVSHNFISLN